MISNLNMLQIIGDLHRCENCLGFGQDRLSLGRRQMAVAAGNCRVLLKECRLYHKKIGVTHDGVKSIGGPGIADDDELTAAL
jgi:hypothetical protein